MKIVFAIFLLLLLLAGVLISLPFLIDLAPYQNRYKPLLEEALNRKIELQGIRLTIWPRIGVRVKGFTVSEDPAFSSTAFASLASLDVGVKLKPLLSGRVEVEEIVLRDPIVHVIKNKNGVMNVSTIGPKTAAPSAPQPEREVSRDPLQALALLAVDRLRIEGGQLVYHDLSTRPAAEYRAEDVQLALNGVRLGEVPTVHLGATVKPHDLAVTLDGSFGPLSEALEFKQYLFKIGIGKVMFDVKGSLLAGRLDTTISSPSINSADVPAHLPLTKPVQIKDLSIVATAPYPLKEGVPVMELADIPKLSFAVVMGNSVVDAKGSVLNGHAKVNLSSPSVNTADLPVETGLKKPVALKDLQAAMELELKDQEARLSHLSFQLFDGQVKARGALSLGSPSPPFSGKATVQGVQVGPALDSLNPDSRVSVSGIAGADVTMAGRGFTGSDLVAALEGSGHMEVKDGRIEGVNLVQETVTLLKLAGISVDPAKVTAFSTAETDFSVKQGLITVRNLVLDSQDFQATGGGTISFSQALNLKLRLDLSPDLSRRLAGSSPIMKLALRDGRLRLPLLVTGTTQNPSFGLDVKDMTVKVQEQVQEKAKETLKGLMEGTTKPEDLKRQGKDLLKSLLGQ